MNAFETTTVIERPSQTIWRYAARIADHPAWMSVADGRLLSGSETEVGARGVERLVLGPFRWDVEFAVIESEPGRRIVWQSVADAHLHLTVALTLEPIGPAATHATYRSEVQLRGRGRVLQPLVVLEGAAGVRRELARLRDAVERANAAQPSGAQAAESS